MRDNEERKRAKEIYNRFLQCKSSEEENLWLARWMHQYRANETVDDEVSLMIQDEASHIKEQLVYKINKTTISRRPLYWAAASILLLLSVGVYYLFNNPVTIREDAPITRIDKQDSIITGGVIRLQSGQEIPLHKLEHGIIDSNHQYSLYIESDGSLKYEDKSEDAHLLPIKWIEIVLNPRTQFKLTLPDGSKVWLNALSSLKYPSRFEGGLRQVYLEGEAYFEVEKGKEKFIVETDRQSIEVLGTKFNVSAYKNDIINKTSLLEGKVAVKGNNRDFPYYLTLNPGFEALDLPDKQPILREIEDTSKVTLWTSGDLYFNDDDIYEVMNKIERFYELKVIYPSKKIKQRFTGMVSKEQSVETMLNTLEKITGYTFERNGKEVQIREN